MKYITQHINIFELELRKYNGESVGWGAFLFFFFFSSFMIENKFFCLLLNNNQLFT